MYSDRRRNRAGAKLSKEDQLDRAWSAHERVKDSRGLRLRPREEAAGVYLAVRPGRAGGLIPRRGRP